MENGSTTLNDLPPPEPLLVYDQPPPGGGDRKIGFTIVESSPTVQFSTPEPEVGQTCRCSHGITWTITDYDQTDKSGIGQNSSDTMMIGFLWLEADQRWTVVYFAKTLYERITVNDGSPSLPALGGDPNVESNL